METLYPSRCLFCRSASERLFLCQNCWPTTLCENLATFPGLDGCRSDFDLEERAHRLMHQVKLGADIELWRQFLNRTKTSSWISSLGDVTVVPIPMHPWNRFWRGFNPSELLAHRVSKLHGLPFSKGLIKNQWSFAQKRLSKAERTRNLKNCFHWKLEFCPRRVLLVDDVLTTGATCQAAAKVLKRAGSSEVFCWTVFRTPRRTFSSTTSKLEMFQNVVESS